MEIKRFAFIGYAVPAPGKHIPDNSKLYVLDSDFDRILAEREALQQRLNAVEEENDRLKMVCRSHSLTVDELEDRVERLREMLPACGNCGGCGQVDDGHSSFDCWVCDGIGVKKESRS